MSGLCSFPNITLVSIDSPYGHVITVKPNEKKIVGLIGSCIDQMLGNIEDRKCNIIGAEILGVKLDNGTYTGALGHLQSGEPNFIHEDWLEHSLPLRVENIWASQLVDDQNKLDYFDLLENFKFSLEIYLSYFFAIFIFGLSCYYLIKSNLSENRNYLKQTNGSKFIYFINYLFISRKYKFKFILLFLGLFSWFTLLFLTNTIKTNKVVVDTSELIKDKDALMKSGTFCFVKDDTAYNLALNSNNNSLLYRLFNDKTKFKDDQYKYERSILKKNRCFVNHNIENLRFFKKAKAFILSQIETMAIFIYVETLKIAKKIFLLTKGIQEYNVVIYYLKYKSNKYMNFKLKEFLDFSNKFKYILTESGRNVRLYDCMESNAELIYSKTIKVYKEVYEYVEDNTGNFADLELNNFSSLFIIYFAFLTLIFIVFFILQIAQFYYSKLISLINKIWTELSMQIH